MPIIEALPRVKVTIFNRGIIINHKLPLRSPLVGTWDCPVLNLAMTLYSTSGILNLESCDLDGLILNN
jgi:hypothetical protein